MAAEEALIQIKGGAVLHAEEVLQEGDRPGGKVAPQQKRIERVDGRRGDRQQGGRPEKELPSQLAEMSAVPIFQ